MRRIRGRLSGRSTVIAIAGSLLIAAAAMIPVLRHRGSDRSDVATTATSAASTSSTTAPGTTSSATAPTTTRTSSKPVTPPPTGEWSGQDRGLTVVARLTPSVAHPGDTVLLHVEAHQAAGAVSGATAGGTFGAFDFVKDCTDPSPNPTVNWSVDQKIVVQDSGSGGPPSEGRHAIVVQVVTMDNCQHLAEVGNVTLNAYLDVTHTS